MARSKKKEAKKLRFELGIGGLVALAVSTLCVLLWVFVLGFWVGQKMMGKSIRGLEIPATATMPSLQVKGEGPGGKKTPPPRAEANPAGERPGPRATDGPSGVVEEKIQDEAEESESGPAGVTSVTPQETGKVKQPPAAAARRPAEPAASSRRAGTSARVKPRGTSPSYFVLQIAAYKDRKRAGKEAARWARKGYYTQVKKVDLGAKKGVWYRVYLGRFDSLGRAREFAVKLADKEGLKSYVVPLKE